MAISLPTIKIVAPDVQGGYMIINESDFNPATMERWYAPGEAPYVAPPPAEVSPFEPSVPLMKIKAEDMPEGYRLITAEQFDAATMQVWDEPSLELAQPTPPESSPPGSEVSEHIRRRSRG